MTQAAGTRSSEAGSHRISDVEILRAFGILSIVQTHTVGSLFHTDMVHPAGINGWISYGTSVNLFFVVSGFVVARSLRPSLRGSDGLAGAARTAWNFWVARVWRLIPSAWLWLGIILGASAIFGPAGHFGEFHDNLRATSAGMFNYANWHFARCFGSSHCGDSFHYWTLSLEEQFYFVLPIVIVLTGRAFPVVVVVLAIQQLSEPIATTIAYATRVSGFALGVALALFEGTALHRRLRPRYLERHAALRWIATIGLMLALGFTGSYRFPFPLFHMQVACLVGALLVLIASYNLDLIAPGRGSGRGWVRAGLERVGHRSYGFYLIHVPMIALMQSALDATGRVTLSAWITVPALYAASYILADLNFRLLERGLRQRFGRIGMIGAARGNTAPPPAPPAPPPLAPVLAPPLAPQPSSIAGEVALPNTRAGRRNADVEVVRAFAIVFVLIEHANFNLFPLCEPLVYRVRPYLQFWSGVDLFFVVSGFVIAGTFLPIVRACGNLREFGRAASAFWIRRAGRLMPTAWLWLGVILLGSAFYNHSNAWYPFTVNLHGVVDSVLDIQNLHLARHLGQSPGASFPYWSLSLEEQFYVVMPIAAYLLGARLGAFLILIAALQFFAVRTGSLAPLSSYLNQFRTDGFAIGILIFLWSERRSWRLSAPSFLLRLGPVRIVATLALLAFVAFWSGYGARLVPNQIGFVTLACGAIVLIASHDRDLLWPPGLSRRVLMWLGSRSYAIYVVHIPCFDIVRETWFRATHGARIIDTGGGHVTLAIALALVGVAAELTHGIVERPLRRATRRIAARVASGGTPIAIDNDATYRQTVPAHRSMR